MTEREQSVSHTNRNRKQASTPTFSHANILALRKPWVVQRNEGKHRGSSKGMREDSVGHPEEQSRSQLP